MIEAAKITTILIKAKSKLSFKVKKKQKNVIF